MPPHPLTPAVLVLTGYAYTIRLLWYSKGASPRSQIKGPPRRSTPTVSLTAHSRLITIGPSTPSTTNSSSPPPSRKRSTTKKQRQPSILHPLLTRYLTPGAQPPTLRSQVGFAAAVAHARLRLSRLELIGGSGRAPPAATRLLRALSFRRPPSCRRGDALLEREAAIVGGRVGFAGGGLF